MTDDSDRSGTTIRLNNLSKSYGQTRAVIDLTLTITAGELLVLLGTSGCGKTTTLKLINRLIEPTGGTVDIGGIPHTDINIVELRRSIGYIFQGVGLFPHMTVGQNVGIAPGLEGWEKSQINARVDELLEMMDLPAEKFRDRDIAELSGGQRQRVGVARALAIQPKIMLMDEPFGALDPLTRNTLQKEYQEIRRSLNVTTIFVTHDMTEALLLGDRIAVMEAGRLVQVGTPHELLTAPNTPYVEHLMATPREQADRLEQLVSGT